MTTTTERLREMAAEHRKKADALDLAATELNGQQVENKQAAWPKQLEAAIAHRRKVKKPKRTVQTLLEEITAILGNNRMSQQDFRAALTAKGIEPRGNLGNLVRHGYVTKNSHGYALSTRQRKAWGSAKRHSNNGMSRPAMKRSKKHEFLDAAIYVLNQAKSPLPFEDFKARLQERLGKKLHNGGMGSLTRYGYATQTKDGYLGTGKGVPAS